jgi:hypothetical protein
VWLTSDLADLQMRAWIKSNPDWMRCFDEADQQARACHWVHSVLFQDHTRDGRLEATAAWVHLSDAVDRGEVWVSVCPTDEGAGRDRDVEGNRRLLAPYLDADVVANSKSHDGTATTARDLIFHRLTFQGDPQDKRIVPAGVKFCLEVGACNGSKAVMNLLVNGQIARFPYKTHDGISGLFLFLAEASRWRRVREYASAVPL